MVLAGPVHGAPGGELDETFGENGRLTIEGRFDGAFAQQPDGKLLVAGATGSGDDSDFAVLRLHSDGSMDETFGTNGIAMIDFFATELALQADGRMIAAGKRSGADEDDLALARLNPDGSLDATFDGDSAPAFAELRGILLLEDGRVVVAGTTYANGIDFAFVQFNADGTLDATFGMGPIPGMTVIDASHGHAGAERFRHDEPLSITRQFDGKYVACGFADTDYWDYVGTMVAVRVNPDGSIDAGFGINGVSRIETAALANTCIAMPDGTIVLAGFRDGDLAFARLTSDGMKDPTFGNSGFSTIDLGGVDSAAAVILLDDGGLGVTGWTGGAFDWWVQPDMYVARVDPDKGLLDASFGNQGVTIVDFGVANQSVWSTGLAVIQQPDGKLVAIGPTEVGVALARVDPAGAGNVGIAGFVFTYTSIAEGTGEPTVSVRRTGGSTGDLSVEYNTVAGTATAPSDFTSSFGILRWASGNMDTKSITVPITDDNIEEGNESFTVVLSNSSGGLAASEFLVTIADKVAPPPPAPAPTPGSDGGGGGVCMELLMLLAMSRAFAKARRRPDCTADAAGTELRVGSCERIRFAARPKKGEKR